MVLHILIDTLSTLALIVALLAALLALAVSLLAALIVGEQQLYRLSRWRSLRTLEKLKAELAAARRYVPVVQAGHQRLLGRFLTPLTRLETALTTLAARTESLEKDNDLRLGPHTRTEWRRLRKDMRAVLKRGRLVHRFFGDKAACDGSWPFNDDHSAVFRVENYSHRPGSADQHPFLFLPDHRSARSATTARSTAARPSAAVSHAPRCAPAVPAAFLQAQNEQRFRTGIANGGRRGQVIAFRRPQK